MMKTFTKLASTLSLLTFALGNAACGTVTSNYHRTSVAPGEVVWNFDGGLAATKNGQTILESGSYRALPEAVSCVEEARQNAERASSRKSAGRVTTWTGIAGTIAGGGAMLYGAAESRLNLTLGGLGTMLGGVIVTLIGASVEGSAVPAAVDAVNIYNDKYVLSPTCSGTSTTAAARP